LDQLLPHKDELERHLRQRLGDLFDLNYDLLLYDITSIYFEGQCALNPLVKRGYSRDGCFDCLQVLIGLVVTEEGFPLGYEVFAGNRNDAMTVDEIMTTRERKYGKGEKIRQG
jgi:transposase